MDPAIITGELKRNGAIWASLLTDQPEAFRQWRPAPEKWSLHEILCHLLDEERFDFRARVRHVLESPGEPMAPIDPVGWVGSKNYAGWDYQETLQQFLEERRVSIQYLESLQGVSWQQVHHHPRLGPMRAIDFLNNWLAHDYLHFRQVNRYRYEWLRGQYGAELGYAGDW